MRIRPQKTPVSKSLKYWFFRSQVFIEINTCICKCHINLISPRSSKIMHWVTLGRTTGQVWGCCFFSFVLFICSAFLICLICIAKGCFRLLVVNYSLLLVCELFIKCSISTCSLGRSRMAHLKLELLEWQAIIPNHQPGFITQWLNDPASGLNPVLPGRSLRVSLLLPLLFTLFFKGERGTSSDPFLL